MAVPGITQQTEFVLCQPRGELDAPVASKLRGALAEAASYDTNVIVDLTAVTFVDSSGLAVLVGAIHRVRAAGHSMLLCAPKTSVGRALRVAGLTRIVDVVDSLDDARAMFAACGRHPSVPPHDVVAPRLRAPMWVVGDR